MIGSQVGHRLPARTDVAIRASGGFATARAMVIAKGSARIAWLQEFRYQLGAGRMPKIDRLSASGLLLLTSSVALWFAALQPLRQNVVELREEVSRLEAAAGPDGPGRASVAGQASAFLHELPTRTELPAVLAKVVTLATAAGLQLDQGNYEFTQSKKGQVSRYRLTLPVRGTYGQVRKFVDGTLASVPAVALESLKLERKEIASDQIEADLQFAVMTRSAP